MSTKGRRMAVQSYLKLDQVATSSGFKFPTRVLGSGGKKFEGKLKGIVESAKSNGVRAFDTGDTYKCEAELAECLHAHYPDAILIEKIRLSSLKNKTFEQHINDILAKFQRTQIDVLLLHWPHAFRSQTLKIWQQMIQCQEEGKVKMIGLSNCDCELMEYLEASTGVHPAVIETHFNPVVYQPDIVRYCHERGILVVGFSLFSGTSWGSGSLLKHPTVTNIATKVNKAPAQVLVCWCLMNGVIPLTAATSAERVREFVNIDFELSDADVAELSNLRSFTTTTTIQCAVFTPLVSGLPPPLAVLMFFKNVGGLLVQTVLQYMVLGFIWATHVLLSVLSEAMNLIPRFSYKPQNLTAVEQRLLQSIKDNGYAITSIQELSNRKLDFEGLVKTQAERKGQGGVFRWTSWVKRPDGEPELNEEEKAAVSLTFSEEICRVCSEYYKMAVSLNFSWIKYTKAGSRPENDAGWHSDHEDLSCLKVFLYLTDVTSEGCCPFTLVQNTHEMRPSFLRARFFTSQMFKLTSFLGPVKKFHDPDVLKSFSPQQVVSCYGPAGTLVIVDVSCLHKIHIPYCGSSDPRCVVMSCLTKRHTLGVPNVHSRTQAMCPWMPSHASPSLSSFGRKFYEGFGNYVLYQAASALVRLPVLMTALCLPNLTPPAKKPAVVDPKNKSQ